ncbi:MAG: 50S ribosomal protein L6 [Bifidobacteriaceae bacterium]|jgi:large subunit ribosomal protein L6|nr:50S ribosomal protein L6 [Bifidobacteriaceae bacterium]
MTSRIGKVPVAITAGVDVNLAGDVLTVKGPKGEMTQVIHELVIVKIDGDNIIVTAKNESKTSSALHGLMRSLIANMVEGVTNGFEKKLELVGTGYRVALAGSTLDFSLGFSHPVKIDAPEGITFGVQDNNIVIISGIDKQQVGEVAANIRKIRPPEPYKGKGIRYVGEVVKRKVGKAGA